MRRESLHTSRSNSILGELDSQRPRSANSPGTPLIPPDHPELHPLFGSRHPGYPAFEQFEEVEQVQIGFVENHDLPGQQARARLPSFLGVAVTRRVHERKPGQKTLQIEPQMTFSRRLAPPVLGPV